MLKPFKKGYIVLWAMLFMLEMRIVVAKEPMEIPVHPVPLEIHTSQGTISYKVEIAFTPSQEAAGLMYRTDFPRDRAMLFKQKKNYQSGGEQKLFMWMKNTPLPLDMIFLNSEGVIVSIIENTSPFSKKIISSGVPAAFALEINAGEVSEKQIQKGQHIIHPVICGKCNKQ
ncbi:DUF192 domain-containing protein [Bartonella krasnovii]|uniref:DUF192 domain-containing protein n=1 Tax=Bartonella krasnovii TaxID=2267275 RepID=A0A5B9D1T7_9HYPH|nr:DUF192 domain-containing protein [Bartonella krasnovii]QEE12229.1 DUF192 domain-containing protein [Bartonella krasnovii]UNF43081.1 DUF192 domain-containing protein [Bartonella krasnovii]UNF47777.1 DUF192 domain-containing protein [Bartonella krasnovii]UNF54541.1 DUF192 domain-containing protein [Bartonella krasnovii]UNF56291.1 DUF192 domain-containing protein [Bartonella krasnovii]